MVKQCLKKPIRYDLVIYKGQTYDQNIRFVHKDTGDPVLLDGVTAKAQIRPSQNSPKLTAQIATTVYPDEGKINILLDADTTEAMAPGFYEWDLRTEDVNDIVKYFFAGKVIVTGRVTV